MGREQGMRRQWGQIKNRVLGFFYCTRGKTWPPLTRVQYWETELRDKFNAAGGIWRPRHKLWEMRYEDLVTLGLESRVVWDDFSES